MGKELFGEYKPQFVEFPATPRLIFINGATMPVYEYISPEVFIPRLKMLTSMINFRYFDAIAYNLKGGEFPAKLIRNFSGRALHAIPIEYHPSGKIATPIPKYLSDKRVLVIEDIFDTGISKDLMKFDCPNVHLVVMSQKIEVEDQSDHSNVTPLFLTVNKWQAGAGMNIEFENDPYFLPDTLRTFPGIVIRPPEEILKIYLG